MGHGVLRARRSSTAAGETVIGERPGGQLKPFCVQLKAMSMPDSSTLMGMAPSEVTQSAIMMAPARAGAVMAADSGARRWRFRRGRRRRRAAVRDREVRGLGFGEGFAPGLFAADDVGAVAAAHLGDALGEIAGGEDGEFLAGLDEVRERGFHAGAAGSGDGVHEGILGAEEGAQVAADFFATSKKKGSRWPTMGLAMAS